MHCWPSPIWSPSSRSATDHPARAAFNHSIVNHAENMSDPEPEKTAAASSSGSERSWIWRLVKWSLCVVVVGFVAQRAYDLWNQNQGVQLEFHLHWLIAAGCVYLLGWLPSVWFWRKLMSAYGSDVALFDGSRAYYCGHLGKYVPGKAMVLVIRAGLLRDRGVPLRIAAFTAAVETLLFMGVGLAVGLALLPATGWPKWLHQSFPHPLLPLLVVLVGCLILLPLFAKILTLIAEKMVPADLKPAEGTLRIPKRLLAAGLAALVVSWMLLGLSLGLTIHSVSEQSFAWWNWPVWTGAVAIAHICWISDDFRTGWDRGPRRAADRRAPVSTRNRRETGDCGRPTPADCLVRC